MSRALGFLEGRDCQASASLKLEPMVQVRSQLSTRFSSNVIRGLSGRAKFLLALWSLFLLLVAFGIHGSSTAITAGWWAPERPYSGYLLSSPHYSSVNEAQFRGPQMAQPRWIRWDELSIATPLALAQLSHKPRFPVINTNIGIGQNMLLTAHWPVWHIATLARPATWGYFLFGAQRGLAWYWWFQPFACFTALYLLLEIVLRQRTGLAAFGAFWFCGSAYVVCWSLWPAHITFFAALSSLAGYHLLKSDKLRTQIVCAILLGLSLAGLLMFMYPPWQVSVAYLFLAIFAGLFFRDKLFLSFKPLTKARLLCIAGALLIAGGLTASFALTCWSDFKIMSDTVYPGKRVSLGGDYSFPALFEGLYNFLTIYDAPPFLSNQTEAASFYYLFPAVFLGLVLSNRFRKALGVVGWVIVGYLILMLGFLFVGLPEVLAKATLLGYVPSFRADVGVGLASIILCVYSLSLQKGLNQTAQGWWVRIMPVVASALVLVLFVFHGLALAKRTGHYLSTDTVLLFSTIAGCLSYVMLSGRSALFCLMMGVSVVLTTATFNPLCTNLDHIYKSELAEQIVRFDNESNDRPLWLCYGSIHPGILVTALGGRSLSGLYWPPQLSLWREFDPLGSYQAIYNRYAHFQLAFEPADLRVGFEKTWEDSFILRISPNNPILISRGARYVLAMGSAQQIVRAANLVPVYKSPQGAFTIYEIGLKAPP